MKRTAEVLVIAAALCLGAPAVTLAQAPTGEGPRHKYEDYPLTNKLVDQWLAFMTGLTSLAESDPALRARLEERDRKEKEARQAGGDNKEPHVQLEAMMKEEPKIKALIDKVGLKPVELSKVSVAVMMTSMAVHMSKSAPEFAPKLKAGSVQAKNFALVDKRLPELTKALAGMQRLADKNKAGKAPPAE